MKAAFLEQFKQPLVIRDIDQPSVSEDEVLVKVEACDLSRGTFDLITGGADVRPPQLPIIPGSGASGTIERIGNQVKKVNPGDRVVIHGMIYCGKCSLCLEKRDNICLHSKYLGRTVNGVLAEFIKVPEANVLPISHDLGFPETAIVSSTLAVSYHALDEAKIEPEHTVAIYGIGSLGLGAVALLIQKNSRIIAIDIDETRLNLARELGVWKTINVKQEKPSYAVLKLTEMQGVDRALVMVGEVEAIQEALISMKPGGKVIVAGHAEEPFTLKPIQIIRKEISLAGIRHATYQQLSKAILQVEQQRINLNRLISHVLNPLSAVNYGLEILQNQNPLKVIVCPWEK